MESDILRALNDQSATREFFIMDTDLIFLTHSIKRTVLQHEYVLLFCLFAWP